MLSLPLTLQSSVADKTGLLRQPLWLHTGSNRNTIATNIPHSTCGCYSETGKMFTGVVATCMPYHGNMPSK